MLAYLNERRKFAMNDVVLAVEGLSAGYQKNINILNVLLVVGLVKQIRLNTNIVAIKEKEIVGMLSVHVVEVLQNVRQIQCHSGLVHHGIS